MTEETEILARMKTALVLPPSELICQEAVNDVLKEHSGDRNWIKSHFSKLVEEVQAAAYMKYLTAERPAAAAAIRAGLETELKGSSRPEAVFDLIQRYFGALDKFFLSLTQGRRPRAGKAFEKVIKVLFDQLGYPYTAQPVINGQPDFLLPSVHHYRNNSMDCVIFTVKRTLRERWRQIVTEGTRGHQFFLATIDQSIAARDLPELLRNRVYLVVPESIRLRCYPTHINVISFETFFSQHLDPAMRRWIQNGIVTEQ